MLSFVPSQRSGSVDSERPAAFNLLLTHPIRSATLRRILQVYSLTISQQGDQTYLKGLVTHPTPKPSPPFLLKRCFLVPIGHDSSTSSSDHSGPLTTPLTNQVCLSVNNREADVGTLADFAVRSLCPPRTSMPLLAQPCPRGP